MTYTIKMIIMSRKVSVIYIENKQKPINKMTKDEMRYFFHNTKE